MFQKFKIVSYAFIIALLFVFPSQAAAGNASSCRGFDCSIEGQICPQGVPGASAGSYICQNTNIKLSGHSIDIGGKTLKWVRDVDTRNPEFGVIATSCTGWSCSESGQICPRGVPGASADSYYCDGTKWKSFTEACRLGISPSTGGYEKKYDEHCRGY